MARRLCPDLWPWTFWTSRLPALICWRRGPTGQTTTFVHAHAVRQQHVFGLSRKTEDTHSKKGEMQDACGVELGFRAGVACGVRRAGGAAALAVLGKGVRYSGPCTRSSENSNLFRELFLASSRRCSTAGGCASRRNLQALAGAFLL
jgi:hypothetical protein